MSIVNAVVSVRYRKPPSQTWRTFLDNHLGDIAVIDFFAVPTVRFRLLDCFIVLRHEWPGRLAGDGRTTAMLGRVGDLR